MHANNNQQDGESSNAFPCATTSSSCGLILLDNNQLENLLRLYIILEELSTNSLSSLSENGKVKTNGNETMKQTSQEVNVETDLFHSFKHQNDSHYPIVDTTTTTEIFPTTVDNQFGKLTSTTIKPSKITSVNAQRITTGEISHNSNRRKFICSTLESIREEQEVKKSQPKRPRGRPRKNSFEIKNETKRLKMD